MKDSSSSTESLTVLHECSWLETADDVVTAGSEQWMSHQERQAFVKSRVYSAIELTKLPLPEALEVLRGIESEPERAKALGRLAPYLPEELLPEALAVAHEIKSDSERAKALSELAQ